MDIPITHITAVHGTGTVGGMTHGGDMTHIGGRRGHGGGMAPDGVGVAIPGRGAGEARITAGIIPDGFLFVQTILRPAHLLPTPRIVAQAHIVAAQQDVTVLPVVTAHRLPAASAHVRHMEVAPLTGVLPQEPRVQAIALQRITPMATAHRALRAVARRILLMELPTGIPHNIATAITQTSIQTVTAIIIVIVRHVAVPAHRVASAPAARVAGDTPVAGLHAVVAAVTVAADIMLI